MLWIFAWLEFFENKWRNKHSTFHISTFPWWHHGTNFAGSITPIDFVLSYTVASIITALVHRFWCCQIFYWLTFIHRQFDHFTAHYRENQPRLLVLQTYQLLSFITRDLLRGVGPQGSFGATSWSRSREKKFGNGPVQQRVFSFVHCHYRLFHRKKFEFSLSVVSLLYCSVPLASDMLERAMPAYNM
jgi:hypothetical protein